jgi:large subunit ribosomal protein L10
MRKEKQLLLDEIKEQVSQNGSFVVMRYANLSANKANEFRRDIAKIGGSVAIMRKRVLLKAAGSAGLTLSLKELPGHIGLIYTANDPVEMTKFVFQFGQDNDKVIQVIGGRIEGVMYNGTQVEKLSKLPGKNEMRAQFLSVLEAPMAETLAVIDALLTSVPHCLENKCQLEQGSSSN